MRKFVKKNKYLSFFLILTLLSLGITIHQVASARSSTGLNQYWFQVVDENGEAITSGLKVSILAADGAIATVYSDGAATALTNPITSTVHATLTNGKVEFWYGATTVDIEIVDEKGAALKVEALGPTDHKLVFDLNRADVQLVYGNTAFSDELVDSAAAFTDFSLTRTLEGENLKAGDVVEIRGTVLFEDFNAADTLDLKLLFGTEVILQTTDQTPAADEDTISFQIFVTVKTAGSSGKLYVHGNWWTDLNGTVVCYIKAPAYANAAGLGEDISGDVVIYCQGDWSAEHADNECVLTDLKVWVHKNGNV